jgi:hypothetical protein
MDISKSKLNLLWRRAAILSLAMSVVISMFAVTPVLAEGEPERQFVLEGLDGVHVIVPSITGMDVDRAGIASAVEDRIKSSGLKVISESEYLNNTSVKSLVVKIIPLKSGGKTFYSLNLDLTQMIYLSDKASRKVDVSMWDDVTVGFLDKGTKFKEDVLKRVDNFIDMWRRANGNVGPR